MRTRFALVTLIAGLGAPLAAQGATALYTRWNALSGFEFQRYSFSGALSVQSATQWSFPVVVVAPLGRQMSLDVTTHLAHSEVSGVTTEDFTGLTDTQLRLLYTLGRDRAVASLSFNLPTGKHSFPTSQFGVSSAMSSNFLSFPVSSLGSGFGITGGVAYAVPAGGWNLGFAGSVRYQSSYKPFSDQALTYNPGLEGRLRLGADRVIGQRSRLLVGLTYSTFSTDQFSGSGAIVSGWYNPGPRIISDLGYAYTWGRTTVTVGAWDYLRLDGSTQSTANDSLSTKENVINAELRLARQLSARVVLEPVIGIRQWNPDSYRGGRMGIFGLNGRFGLSDRFSATLGARLTPGWVYEPSQGRSDVTGSGVSLLIRYQR
jgi:hypothetical protein